MLVPSSRIRRKVSKARSHRILNRRILCIYRTLQILIVCLKIIFLILNSLVFCLRWSDAEMLLGFLAASVILSLGHMQAGVNAKH